MNQPNPKDPLHGVTLQTVVTALVDHFGWDELGRIIDIRCFNFDPSISSSLKFLRKTPWARKKVEDLFLGCGLDAASGGGHGATGPNATFKRPPTR